MTSSEMKKYFKKQQMKSFFAIVKDYKRYYLGSLLWLNAFKILNNKAKMQKWQQKHKERYENLQLAIKKYKWTKNAILQSKIWLNSNRIQRKIPDTNHPYPPLLNPNDIDYEIIPAELVNPLNLNRQISLYFTKNFTHFMNYIKKLRIANPLNIDNLTKMDKDIFIGVNFSDFDEARVFALKLLSQGNKMFGLENISNINFENIKFALSFGITSLAENIQMFDKIKDKPIIFYEDSYLSCVTLVNSHNKLGSDIKFEYPRSFFLDDLGQHFNVFYPSRLEVMLNDVNLVITDKQKQEARKLIDFIVKNKLSKYNNQPIYNLIIGNYNRKKVLVIEQAMADYSIYMYGANDYTFEEMLQSAILENPNCDIIVKRHPESVLGFRGGYYSNVKQNKNVYPINIAINPYSLLDIVDKVYVCCSTVGLEAAMAGKEVHLFSCPSYAGWGFTKDRKSIPQRKHKRSIEEFVYITYFKYARYINEQGFCSVWEMADTLLKLRDEYFKEYHIQKEQ